MGFCLNIWCIPSKGCVNMKTAQRRTKNQTDISAYKCMRNKVNAAVRKAKSMYHKKLLKENSTDPNKFWKTLKSIYPTKSSDKQSPQSFEINGDKVRDPSKIANAFCSFSLTS